MRSYMSIGILTLSLLAWACGMTVTQGRDGWIIRIPGPTKTITAKGLEDAKDKILAEISQLQSTPPGPETQEYLSKWNAHLTKILDTKANIMDSSEAGDSKEGASSPAPAPL